MKLKNSFPAMLGTEVDHKSMGCVKNKDRQVTVAFPCDYSYNLEEDEETRSFEKDSWQIVVSESAKKQDQYNKSV